MKVNNYNYIVIGGGIIGSAIAYSLSLRLAEIKSTSSIAVLDPDLEGEYSSTLKNAGGVRSTWRNIANIELCQSSIEFYQSIKDKVDFRQKGYYWLHNDDSWQEITRNKELYRRCGINIEFHKPEDVIRILPFVDNTKGISGLTVSVEAGLIDHYLLRQFYRENAIRKGVHFIDRRWVNTIDVSGRRVSTIRTCDISDIVRDKGSLFIRRLLETGQMPRDHHKCHEIFECDTLINATGAWSSSISDIYGIRNTNILPRRRQMVVISCREADLRSWGMIIDTSDVYFHQEGEYIVAGYSDKDEPYGVNFDFDYHKGCDQSKFVKNIWKPLWKRAGCFERIKFIRGWSGIYGETPDRSGYLGRTEGLDNVYECCGHTGRGIMISYGASEAFTELIIDGVFSKRFRHAVSLSRERPDGPLFEQLHL